MRKSEMIQEIRSRLQDEYEITIAPQILRWVLDIEEDTILQCIATNDSYKYIWGTISGTERAPRKLGGRYSQLERVRMNFGYSLWRNGCPNVKWSRVASRTEGRPPEEFFSQPKERYTTAARKFRKDCGLAEIPEYEGLPEDKIEEICERADEAKKEILPKWYADQKEASRKYQEAARKGIYLYWKLIGYTPMGVTAEDFDGDQRDMIDCYLLRHQEEINGDDPIAKMKIVHVAKDMIRSQYKNVKPHPEVDELEKSALQLCKDKGVDPPEYHRRDYYVDQWTPEHLHEHLEKYGGINDSRHRGNIAEITLAFREKKKEKIREREELEIDMADGVIKWYQDKVNELKKKKKEVQRRIDTNARIIALSGGDPVEVAKQREQELKDELKNMKRQGVKNKKKTKEELEKMQEKQDIENKKVTQKKRKADD